MRVTDGIAVGDPWESIDPIVIPPQEQVDVVWHCDKCDDVKAKLIAFGFQSIAEVPGAAIVRE